MTSNVQISGKSPSGTILVVGGNTYDDFYQNLLATVGDTATADAVVQDAVRTIIPVSAGAVVQQSAPQSYNPTPQQAQQVVEQSFGATTPAPVQPPAARPAPQGAPPGQTPPVCDHGYAREYKSGTNAQGKSWKAWMCPMPKGQSCAPAWIR